jgi:hypothetical protein
MKCAIAFVVLSGLLAVQAEEADVHSRFSSCLSKYYVSKTADGDVVACETIVALGRCLAKAGANELPGTHSVRIAAETVYLGAQKENQDCSTHDDKDVKAAGKVRTVRSGDLQFDVHEGKDVEVFRFRREVVSLFDLSETVATQTSDIAQINKDIEQMTEDVAATNKSTIERVENIVDELKADSAATAKATSDLIAELQKNVTQLAKDIKDETDKAIEAVKDDTKDKIAAIPKPYYMEEFVRWGARECPKVDGVTEWYHGHHFNGHQGHGGGSDHLCIRNANRGANGGNHIGGSSYDLLYPAGIDHNGGTTVTRGYQLPCAVCMSNVPCMKVIGRKDCPEKYSFRYRGYMFGNHHSHRLSGNRVCIDRDFRSNLGYGGYAGSWLYSTRIHNRGGANQITESDSVECGMCCYDGE